MVVVTQLVAEFQFVEFQCAVSADSVDAVVTATVIPTDTVGAMLDGEVAVDGVRVFSP